MEHQITIPDELYHALARIANERGFDIDYFILQLLEHDCKVWTEQLKHINIK